MAVAPAAKQRGWPLVLGATAVLAVSLGLFAYFGGGRLLSTTPHAGNDFDTHIEQTWRALEGWRGWGQGWVYDVHLLAGIPTGAIFECDNHGWAAWVAALEQLGVPRGLAFNLFVVLAHLGVAPVVYAAARQLELSRGAAITASAFAVVYWNFDAWTHWVWYVGMIAYALAGYAAVLPLALFHRFAERREPWVLVLVAGLLALLHRVHPYVFFVLVGPMLAVYVRAARAGLGVAAHVGVLATAGITVAFNAGWLAVALSFWHYALDSSLFADTGASSIAWDLLGILTDPATTGVIGKLTLVRTLLLAMAAVQLWLWHREGDRRALPFTVALAVLLTIAYFGPYTVLAHTQPYRSLLPVGFIATIPAAALLERAIRARVWQTFPPAARVTVVLLAIPATLALVREVLYFASDTLPRPRMLPQGERVDLGALGYPPPPSYGYVDWHAEGLAAWVRKHDDGSGRFLVEGWSWGEQLAWKTDAQIMGGFIWRNVRHGWAHYFRRKPRGIASEDELRAYVDRYAVHWVVVTASPKDAPWWDRFALLERVPGPKGYRFYRVREPTRLVETGPGVVEAATNRIRVHGSDPNAPVVLRYHWLETLVCEPGCKVERKRVRGDPVGFIRVPAPHPAAFEITNAYAFP